ncbi:MAG: hypothetical protein DRG78_12495 [Epsilonproteobacteria bacterium]|nr:MAG: hypothetical protein DRG78_12495 [Campylobacterota bacterium]
MLVNITDLPTSIKNKLPYSIRLLKKPIELTSLPISIQYEISNFFNNQLSPNVYVETAEVYDVSPKMTASNDMSTLSIKKDLLMEYLNNYFNVPLGIYPFDPLFGNELKKYLQTKNTTVRNTLISNEVSKIINTVNTAFNSNIQVIDLSLIPVEFGSHVEYKISIDISINDDIDNPIKETIEVA